MSASTALLTVLASAVPMLAANTAAPNGSATLRQYCVQCHNNKATMGGMSLEALLASDRPMGEQLQQWEKVAAVLEQKRMPPPRMPQPAPADRDTAANWIRASLRDYAQKHAGDPGRVTVRRLTSGEYTYSVQDLTGLELKFDKDFVEDSVGGEGFTNFGDVQFMGDANLERYLQSAKRIADHAVIGSGPLQFFADPGKSGFELSAIDRIQRIYTANGFRAASGEGGKPYGLDKFAKAFYVAWRFQHRAAFNEPKATLADIARRESVAPKFAEHIWSVIRKPAHAFPTAEPLKIWNNLPSPPRNAAPNDPSVEQAHKGCEEIQKFLVNWPRWLLGAGELAAGGLGDERALVLNDESVQAKPRQKLRFIYFNRGPAQKKRTLYLTLAPANPDFKGNVAVLWRDGVVRFRKADRAFGPELQLLSLVDDATRERLGFGKERDGIAVPPAAFATAGEGTVRIDLETAEPTNTLELQVDAELVTPPAANGDSPILRATVSDQADLQKGRPVSALLGHPDSRGFKTWKSNVLEFAANLPQISHGEATPSDKDPIPAPYNNVYNQPERDEFHVKVKYYRTDKFLTEKMLDDETRARLDQAWTDLLSSFEYHDAFLNFVAGKYKLDLKKKSIAQLDAAAIEALPAEPRGYVKALKSEYDSIQRKLLAAQPGHIEDCLKFASMAWRRPLTPLEKDKLRSFYTQSREAGKLDHGKATRALIARILVSPSFLFRFEPTSSSTTGSSLRPLAGWELASRISYFLWSSLPDAELRRAAAAGELNNPESLAAQVRRMTADPKARRVATEFYGQWLGFYRFDSCGGVDTGRYPEFNDELKAGLYDEAVTFFEHIVRNNRPLDEMLNADYTFLTPATAKHYGAKVQLNAASKKAQRVENASAFQRGGMLRLGAVLTATSAPLRTSPVKRGDWVLRRVLGTPTPPPPPNAGTIPADDKAFGGLSVRERLAVHKKNATCAACHIKIDPLGFPFENYDAVGRWRDNYQDGKVILDDTAKSTAAADPAQPATVDGLLSLLKAQERQVRINFARKITGYALGRTMIASDQQLIDKLSGAGTNATFADLAVEIVQSKQFRNRRDKDDIESSTAKPQVARSAAMSSIQTSRGRK